jgi:hypothetical protein
MKFSKSLAKAAPIVELPSLSERVKTMVAELEAHIDSKAAELKASTPGVPEPVLRQMLTRGSACPCSVVLRLEKGK